MGQCRSCGVAQAIIAAHAAELRRRRPSRITVGASTQHCDSRRPLTARSANQGVDLLHSASTAVEKVPCVKCQAYVTSYEAYFDNRYLIECAIKDRPATRVPHPTPVPVASEGALHCSEFALHLSNIQCMCQSSWLIPFDRILFSDMRLCLFRAIIVIVSEIWTTVWFWFFITTTDGPSNNAPGCKRYACPYYFCQLQCHSEL